MNVDLVSIVFREELQILKTQAQSIDLYLDNIGTRSIFVIVNDDDKYADEIDPAWWGKLSHKVRIIPRSHFSTEYVENGWLSQQVLKILGASLSYSDWCLILDAKILFVKTPSTDFLVSENGVANSGIMPIQPVFEPSRQIVNKLYDIDLPYQLGPGGVPAFFNPMQIRRMIAHIEQKTNTAFPKWFQDQGMLTEFILYSGHIYSLPDHGASLHNLDGMTFPVCHVCHSDSHQYDSKIKKMVFSTSVCIHRRAWENLGSANQEWFKRFINSRGLSL